jgi:hypothetical protein
MTRSGSPAGGRAHSRTYMARITWCRSLKFAACFELEANEPSTTSSPAVSGSLFKISDAAYDLRPTAKAEPRILSIDPLMTPRLSEFPATLTALRYNLEHPHPGPVGPRGCPPRIYRPNPRCPPRGSIGMCSPRRSLLTVGLKADMIKVRLLQQQAGVKEKFSSGADSVKPRSESKCLCPKEAFRASGRWTTSCGLPKRAM